jgi:hypothetical protein
MTMDDCGGTQMIRVESGQGTPLSKQESLADQIDLLD